MLEIVTLKKPSEFFQKKIISVDESIEKLEKKPELNTFSEAFNVFKDNLSKIEILSNFSETLDTYKENVERVNFLSEKIEDIQIEIKNLLSKEDLDRAMMSQLLVVEQSIQEVQNNVQGINQDNLSEIRLEVSELTENVNEFLENEVPRYKKLVVDSEFRTYKKYEKLEENVSEVLERINEFVEIKYQELTENLDQINQDALLGILNNFKDLEKTFVELKEQEIPKYKGLIVETKLKTEQKIIDFEEKFNETVSSVFDKLSLIENDKSNIVEEVQQRIDDIKSLSQIFLKQSDLNEKYKDEITKKVSSLEVDILRNENHLKTCNQSLEKIQESFKISISKLNLEEIENQNYELGKKVKYLEEVFEKFNEKEILTEGLLNEPPANKNADPLTPLDKNFVTLEQLQQHYRLFINRIQQQLATFGGGGETRLEFLDDVDRNSVKQDGYVLQYNSSSGKFIGTSYVPGGGGGNSGGGESYWVGTNVGIYTTGNVGIGITDPQTNLQVIGDTSLGDLYVGGYPTITTSPPSYATIFFRTWQGGTAAFIQDTNKNFTFGGNESGTEFNFQSYIIGAVRQNGVRLRIDGTEGDVQVLNETQSTDSTNGALQVSGGVGIAKDLNVNGNVTANAFYGNGSNLTGIIASGSGVDIQSGGVNIGVASTINVGAGISVSISSGIATISAPTSVILSILTDVSSDGLTIYTGKAAVGIATTQPYWTVRRTLSSTSGIITSVGTAVGIAWTSRTTATYT